MYDIFADLRSVVAETARRTLGVEIDRAPVDFPPNPSMGDLATPLALSLAKQLRRPPREIATKLAEALAAAPGVAAAEIAGPGFVNLRVDRTEAVRALLGERPAEAPKPGKVIVEHTNINPNKAAHIGHLRNAVLGDTLVRALRALGRRVEVQNYIDDTGVQVADVAVALTELAGLDENGFRALVAAAEERRARGGHGVDHDLWDWYAKVTRWYAEDESRAALRAEALRQMERGEGPLARMGALVAREVSRCHLRTMGRLGVRYDVLPRESDILAHHFWKTAFARLKESGAISFCEEGKAAGCWVMNLPHSEEEAGGEEYEKIIVRSNGVVTYVGKDIAYQLWKFGLLGADFEYRPVEGFPGGTDGTLWESAPPSAGAAGAPSFGRGETVYNVIDVRQSYLQRVVKQGLERLGHPDEAGRSIHFSYEMVALTPGTALELQPGLELSEEERRRPYIDMSGRRGIGVKADDLIDILEAKALREVSTRNPELDEEAQRGLAAEIARGALRYYMLRFARNTIVAFDIDAALAFEGETGPYCQYAAVRVRRIVEKLAEREGTTPAAIRAAARDASFAAIPADVAPEHWELVHRAARLPEAARMAVENLEFSTLAKYAFDLAQAINGFYHRHPVLREPDEAVRAARLAVLLVAENALVAALDLMGVPTPERM